MCFPSVMRMVLLLAFPGASLLLKKLSSLAMLSLRLRFFSPGKALRRHLSLSTANRHHQSPEVSRYDQFLQKVSLCCRPSPCSSHRCSQGTWKNHSLDSTHGLCLHQSETSPLICSRIQSWFTLSATCQSLSP